MEQRPIARLTYCVPPDAIKDQPKTEQHRARTLLALDHICGLGQLLRFVEVNRDDDPETIAQHALGLVEGIHAAGDLIVIIGNSVFDELDAMTEAK